MAPPDRVLPRSRRAGNPELQVRRPADAGPVSPARPVLVPRGQGLERDVQAMAIVARMLRQGAERWLKTMTGVA